MFKLFFRNLKGFKLHLIIVIILLLFLNYVRSIIPVITSHILAVISPDKDTTLPKFLSDLITGEAKEQLIITCMILLAAYLCREFSSLFFDLERDVIADGVSKKVQRKFFGHIQNLSYSELTKLETGDLIQRSISDIQRFKRFYSGVLPQFLTSLILIVMFSYQMFLINVQLTLIVVAILPIFTIFSTIYFLSIQKDFNDLEHYEGRINTVVQENLTGIRVVKAFANEKYEIEKLDKEMKNYTSVWHRVNIKMSLFWGISDFVVVGVLAVISLLSIINVYNGVMSLSELAGFSFLVSSIVWRARALGRQLSEFGKTNVAVKRLNDIFNLPTEFAEENKLKPEIKGNIEFKNVSFQFEDATTPVLKNINLSIKNGETIAIIGRTGSGKSTLVNLLNRLLETTNGDILIDGINIKEIDKHYLRKSIGTVMQEPFLYSRTIEENISISDDEIVNDVVEKVATIASVNEDINSFDKKYQTMVGERGVTLSGGQKQRIAIARILTKARPILVFDDSLSAVDTETDLKIRTALNNRKEKATTLIITHRIVTAMNSDKIIILEDGQIIDIGTHQELIKKPGLYQKIYNIQNYFELEGGENNGI